MNNRNYEIKVRLTQAEMVHLNRLVNGSKLSREAYLRQLISGVVPQDAPPPDYFSMMQQRKTVKESGDEEQPVMLRFVSGVNCLRHRAPTMAALCRRFQPGRLKFTLRRKPVFPSAQGRVVSPSKRPNVSPLKLLIPQQRKHSGKRKKPPLPPPRKMPTPLLPQAARPRLLQGKPQKPPQSWRNPQRKRQRPCMRQSLPVVLPPHSRRKFLAVLA